jgi:hypothetical protein
MLLKTITMLLKTITNQNTGKLKTDVLITTPTTPASQQLTQMLSQQPADECLRHLQSVGLCFPSFDD